MGHESSLEDLGKTGELTGVASLPLLSMRDKYKGEEGALWAFWLDGAKTVNGAKGQPSHSSKQLPGSGRRFRSTRIADWNEARIATSE